MDKCIYISKSRIENNISYYKKETNKGIIAIVKNNAYGHGLKEISGIIDSLIDMYGVSNLKEAKELVKFTSKDVLILDKIEEYDKIDKNMIISVISIKHLKELISLGIELRIHLKINIMMKRKGIDINEFDEAMSLISNSKLKLEGIYTHYSSYKRKEVIKQFKLFENCIKRIDTSNLIIHASSSISSLNFKESFTNYIRLGIGMYGFKKLDKCMNELKPSTKLVCYSRNIYKINKFSRFSYHDLYKGKKGYIVMVNMGYGDGLFYDNLKGYLKGNYLKEIGHMNMDNMFFYSKDYVFLDSEIELFGDNISLDYFARKNKIPVCKILALLNNNIDKIVTE